jgi:hypothetical protein
MSETKENKYGEVTIGFGGSEQRSIPIESWLSAHYKDGRKLTIVKMKNKEGYGVTVENHESSDRSTKQEMLLTNETFIALFATMSLHMTGEGIDFTKELAESVVNEDIGYNCSDNLSPKND